MAEVGAAAVAALFVRRDSIYKAMPGVDAYDFDRDARSWPGGCPVVAHPPCRAWGRLRNFAKPRDDERECGSWAVDQVRTWGGVLEHPACSSLWLYKGMPRPGHGMVDEFGGWTLPVWQSWWGHRAQKDTWLYIVGKGKGQIPDLPMKLDCITHKVSARSGMVRGTPGWRPDMKTDEREKTPPALATWLVLLAAGCRPCEWVQ